MNERVDDLSEGQRECLRLVYQHKSSKDIALILDISPHTVDQRIKLAMRTLGANNRREAARLLAESEGGFGTQRLVYQTPDIAENGPIPAPLAPADQYDRQEGETTGEGGSSANASATATVRRHRRRARLRVPYPTYEGQRNELTIAERLIAISMIAISAAMAFGAILAGLEALGQMF